MAESKLLKLDNNNNKIEISGKHNGYRSMLNSVSHHRSVILDKKDALYLVRDNIICNNTHKVEQFWHLSELCEIQQVSHNKFYITNNGIMIRLTMDSNFDVVIPDASTVDNSPVISNLTTAVCANLTLETDALLTCNGDLTITQP